MRSAIWIMSVLCLALIVTCAEKDTMPGISDQPTGEQPSDDQLAGDQIASNHLVEVEEELLALINEERVEAGLPELERDEGLDRIELWYGTEMAAEHHLGHIDLNGRGSQDRARYYSRIPNVRCSEIVQWWSGEPLAQVHYEGYKASDSHHNAYMEVGGFNLGPTTHAGVVAMRGTGPIDTRYEGKDGSYTAITMCDQSITLVIDPFSEDM